MNQEPRPWEEDFYTVFPYLEGRYVDKDGDSYNGIMSPNIISFIRTLEDTIRKEERRKTTDKIVQMIDKEKDRYREFCVEKEYYETSGWKERDKGANLALENILSTLNQMKESLPTN